MSTSQKEIAFGDLDRELTVTRKVLERLPEQHFLWRVHGKSMTLGHLAMHVANLPLWMSDTLTKDGMDMQSPPKMRNEPTGLNDVLQTFDQNAAAVKQALERLSDADLEKTWTLRNGPEILHSQSKRMIVRIWCLNHLIHHRAQLCIYLRLLNVPVPTVYFNTADEPEWKFT